MFQFQKKRRVICTNAGTCYILTHKMNERDFKISKTFGRTLFQCLLICIIFLIEIKREHKRGMRGVGRGEFKKFLWATKIFFFGLNNRRETDRKRVCFFFIYLKIPFSNNKMNSRIQKIKIKKNKEAAHLHSDVNGRSPQNIQKSKTIKERKKKKSDAQKIETS